jgi:hypothetical protein
MNAIRLTRSRRRRLTAVGAALSAALGLTALAFACNVPVFRFALERWRPDPYRAVLFHQGPLTAADLEILRPLEDQQAQGAANIALRTVDVSQLDQAAAEDEQAQLDRKLFAAQKDASLPRLIVNYPEHLRIGVPVWTAQPTREGLAALLDSPVRQELIKRLTEGQTAVWLLLEAGNSEDGVAGMLEAEMKKLEETLKLPELTTAPEDALLAATPLKVAFSLIRVRRDDPAEQALVSMLIHSEPDLAERSDPMVFPVFGRGRALLPLIGAGITAKNIHDSAAFLVGPCSCEVKELNPGFDLLLSTDWEKRLSADGVPLATPPAPAAPTGPPVLVPIPAGAPAATATVPAPVAFRQPIGLSLGAIILGGVLLVGLLLAAVVVAASFGSKPEGRQGH